MSSLGSFSAAKREHAPQTGEPDTFEFCGETFTVRGEIPGMIQLTVGAWFAGGINGNEGAAALRDVIRLALTVPAREGGDEDDSQWQRFYELAVKHGVETEGLAEVAYVLLGAAAGRPTARRSDSSDGSSPTSTSSNSSSSDSPESLSFRPVGEVLAG